MRSSAGECADGSQGSNPFFKRRSSATGHRVLHEDQHLDLDKPVAQTQLSVGSSSFMVSALRSNMCNRFLYIVQPRMPFPALLQSQHDDSKKL